MLGGKGPKCPSSAIEPEIPSKLSSPKARCTHLYKKANFLSSTQILHKKNLYRNKVHSAILVYFQNTRQIRYLCPLNFVEKAPLHIHSFSKRNIYFYRASIFFQIFLILSLDCSCLFLNTKDVTLLKNSRNLFSSLLMFHYVTKTRQEFIFCIDVVQRTSQSSIITRI